MIKGLFIARQYRGRVFDRDFTSSDFWDTEKHGIHIDVCDNYKQIGKDMVRIVNHYDFFITEEIRIQKFRKFALDPIVKNCNKKIFFISQEPFKPDTKSMEIRYFFQDIWYNGKMDYFFVPDAVFTPGTLIDSWWNKYTTTKTYLTGYPRFDYYSDGHTKFDIEKLYKKYNLSPHKKTIFFASYPPYIYFESGDGIYDGIDNTCLKKLGSGFILDLYKSREDVLTALKEFVDDHKEYQCIVKIHPMSFKLFEENKLKSCNEVSGTLLKYYENPVDNFVVIGDDYNSGQLSKEIVTMADIVVGWGSTMLLEGMLLGKKVCHVKFDLAAHLDLHPEFDSAFGSICSKEELFSNITDSNIVYDNKLVQKYFYKLDGMCCDRICTAILKELQTTKMSPTLKEDLVPHEFKK